MKYRIGIDLDGVVFQYVEEFDRLARLRGEVIKESEYDRGIPKSRLIPLLNKLSEEGHLKNLKLYDGILNLMNTLSKDNELHIITARKNNYNGFNDTLHAIIKNHLPYNSIIFSKEKGKFAKSLELDFFLEDNYNNTLDIVNKSNTFVYLIDKPYNKGKLPEQVKRIKYLDEILENLNGK